MRFTSSPFPSLWQSRTIYLSHLSHFKITSLPLHSSNHFPTLSRENQSPRSFILPLSADFGSPRTLPYQFRFEIGRPASVRFSSLFRVKNQSYYTSLLASLLSGGFFWPCFVRDNFCFSLGKMLQLFSRLLFGCREYCVISV
ncbi:hypothetical protein SLA2020_391780 [Shorea laevis]